MVISEKDFNYFLQRNVAFILDNKILKRGKLVLVVKKDYYFIFNMYIDGVLKRIEYPYPFKLDICENGLMLNYNLTSLGLECDEIYYKYISLNKSSNSKLYNNCIRFEMVDNMKNIE